MTIAACTGCLELVKFFVEQGLDPNQKDTRGDDAFSWAKEKSHPAVVEYLKQFRKGEAEAEAERPSFSSGSAARALAAATETPKPEADASNALPPLGPNAITVNIKTLLGTVKEIKTNPEDSIYVLKQRYVGENSLLVAQTPSAAMMMGPLVSLTPEKCRFLLAGKTLENSMTVDQCGLKEGTMIFVMFRLR
jgi:hypothetical protein